MAFGPVMRPRWIRGFIRLPQMNPRIDPAGLAVGRRRRVWTISPAVRSLTGYDTRSSKSPSLAPLMNASISALV